MAAAHPYRFKNIPSLTKPQVALYASLSRTISARPMAADFVAGLEKLLGQLLRGGCRVLKSELRTLALADLVAQSPQLGCYAIIIAAPSAHKIVVDVDASLGALAIDRLLGGSGEAPRMPRPWTDVESGILSYAFLQVLSYVQGGMQTGHELALVLDRVVSTLTEAQASLAQTDGYFQLGYRLDLGGHIGYGRVLLPDALVSEHFCTAPADDTAPTPHELVGMRHNFKVLAAHHIDVRVVAAPLDLRQSDVVEVEVGDIIVLEDHSLKKTTEAIEGEVSLRLGSGRHAHLRGRLHNEADETRLEIIDITSHAQLQEEPMGTTAEENDNLAETAGLLRDVETSVAIELCRLRLTAAQVIRLHRGQVLRLPRGANDPVNLVVNGKLFAKGELIEVDGELGVRLTQLHAAE